MLAKPHTWCKDEKRSHISYWTQKKKSCLSRQNIWTNIKKRQGKHAKEALQAKMIIRRRRRDSRKGARSNYQSQEEIPGAVETLPISLLSKVVHFLPEKIDSHELFFFPCLIPRHFPHLQQQIPPRKSKRQSSTGISKLQIKRWDCCRTVVVPTQH